jgi:hypothetical protein
MHDPMPSRRERRRSAPIVDPHTCQHKLLDIIASGLARLASETLASDISAPKESRGDGLELPQHAALSVSARFPGGERRGPNEIKRGDTA